MFTTLALLSIFVQDAKDQADRMLNLITAEEPIVTIATVNASPKAVWQAWTTDQGITGWMVASGSVDLRVGGALRTSYTKGSDLTGPDVIVNTILAYDPERMITIKTAQTPERFPFKEAMKKCWTVIYMEPVGDAQTKVIVRMLGYTRDEESQQMKAFFRQGNQATLDSLVKYFEKK